MLSTDCVQLTSIWLALTADADTLDGTDGGSSLFGSHITSTGGTGGSEGFAGSAGSGRVGGTVTVGADISLQGGFGVSGEADDNTNAGGRGGIGGVSFWGIGGRGGRGDDTLARDGSAGIVYGSGGGGSNGEAANGANGAAGVVIVFEF